MNRAFDIEESITLVAPSRFAPSPSGAVRAMMSTVASVFCCVTYPDRTGFNTTAASVFEAAVKALEWVEVDRRAFGTVRRFHDRKMLDIGVGMVPDRWYRVNVGRARRWARERKI